MNARPEHGPLASLRVIDLTTTFMGPYCTLLLAQMGADVIKVETPGGDIVRHLGGGRNPGMSPIFLAANHGKRSIVLDLTRAPAMQAMRRLLDSADVFVTNMRPNALAKLGLAYEDLAQQFPRLIHVRLGGFGSAGPRGDEAAYDDVIQAACGLAAVQANESGPRYVRSPIADKVAGLMGVSAVLAAVVDRQATGRGQFVEVPMFETMVQFVLLEQQGGLLFDPPAGPPGYARTASPHRRPYRTADGYISVVVYTDRQWLNFFRLIGRPELTGDPRFATITGRTANIDELYEVVAQSMPARTTAQWLADLRAGGIAAGPVHDLSSLQSDEHLRATDFFERVVHPTEGALRVPRLPVQFSAHLPAKHVAAPSLGAHGVQILESLGFQPDEIRNITDGVA